MSPADSRGPARRWSLLEIIPPSGEYLKAAGIDNARLDAELLLAHALGLRRLDLYLQYERVLSADELTVFRGLLRRRRSREPLQLITGEVEFYGLRLTVRPGVFIPRPETEVLVEQALLHLEKSWPKGNTLRALELGCGTGAISIALASGHPDLMIAASDLSRDAVDLARRNAAALGFADRIDFEEAVGLPGGDGRKVHLVISNPPYIRDDERDSLSSEVADHDPAEALFGGADGLDFYRLLATEAPARLLPGGLVAVEIGETQGAAVTGLLAAAHLVDIQVLSDLAGRDRVVIGRLASQSR